jgi:hypothetical protein
MHIIQLPLPLSWQVQLHYSNTDPYQHAYGFTIVFQNIYSLGQVQALPSIMLHLFTSTNGSTPIVPPLLHHWLLRQMKHHHQPPPCIQLEFWSIEYLSLWTICKQQHQCMHLHLRHQPLHMLHSPLDIYPHSVFILLMDQWILQRTLYQNTACSYANYSFHHLTLHDLSMKWPREYNTGVMTI